MPANWVVRTRLARVRMVEAGSVEALFGYLRIATPSSSAQLPELRRTCHISGQSAGHAHNRYGLRLVFDRRRGASVKAVADAVAAAIDVPVAKAVRLANSVTVGMSEGLRVVPIRAIAVAVGLRRAIGEAVGVAVCMSIRMSISVAVSRSSRILVHSVGCAICTAVCG